VRTPVKFTSAVDIDVDRRDLPRIPQSFLGISHEWPYVEELSNQPSYMEILKLLSSYGGGPMIVRVGGGSSDLQTFVPGKNVWDSLNRLHKATGAKYIIGLNFEHGDVDLARRQMRAAKAGLLPGSILTFEIGNEVRGWMRGTYRVCVCERESVYMCVQGMGELGVPGNRGARGGGMRHGRGCLGRVGGTGVAS
jgi:hypothetical protein